MKYTKPEVQCLADAAKAIQSNGKGTVASTDAVIPHTTISAYEADE